MTAKGPILGLPGGEFSSITTGGTTLTGIASKLNNTTSTDISPNTKLELLKTLFYFALNIISLILTGNTCQVQIYSHISRSGVTTVVNRSPREGLADGKTWVVKPEECWHSHTHKYTQHSELYVVMSEQHHLLPANPMKWRITNCWSNRVVLTERMQSAGLGTVRNVKETLSHPVRVLIAKNINHKEESEDSLVMLLP